MIFWPAQVVWKGKALTYRFVVIGVKGDWPFLRSSFALNNGFNCKDKCHRCSVADAFLKFIDVPFLV